jgi:hypothetical protein
MANVRPKKQTDRGNERFRQTRTSSSKLYRENSRRWNCNADPQNGHLSAALAHFANIATRLGVSLRFDPAKEQFIENDQANQLLRRTYREGHWAAPKEA